MPHFLQIELKGDGFDFTPVDTAISDTFATALDVEIARLDVADSKPGDGELEEPAHASIPIHFAFLHLNVPVSGVVHVRVVEKP